MDTTPSVSFDDETTHSMGVAFDKACQVVELFRRFAVALYVGVGPKANVRGASHLL